MTTLPKGAVNENGVVVKPEKKEEADKENMFGDDSKANYDNMAEDMQDNKDYFMEDIDANREGEVEEEGELDIKRKPRLKTKKR